MYIIFLNTTGKQPQRHLYTEICIIQFIMLSQRKQVCLTLGWSSFVFSFCLLKERKEYLCFPSVFLTPSCWWVDISTWTPTPQGCLYLGPSPSVLDNSFFAESVRTSYNFLASFQIIFNLEHGHIKFLDNFLSIIYYPYLLSTIYSRQERVNIKPPWHGSRGYNNE